MCAWLKTVTGSSGDSLGIPTASGTPAPLGFQGLGRELVWLGLETLNSSSWACQHHLCWLGSACDFCPWLGQFFVSGRLKIALEKVWGLMACSCPGSLPYSSEFSEETCDPHVGKNDFFPFASSFFFFILRPWIISAQRWSLIVI